MIDNDCFGFIFEVKLNIENRKVYLEYLGYCVCFCLESILYYFCF